MITFDTHPTRYHHWKLACDGSVATLSMDVREDAGLSPDYKLKLNSYDLGVDIELASASGSSIPRSTPSSSRRSRSGSSAPARTS